MKKRKVLKSVLFLGAIGIVVNQLDDRVVDPILDWFIPASPVIIYNVIATAFTLLFGLALVWFSWKLIRGAWRLVSSHYERSNLWNRFQQWSPSKRDVLVVASFTWSTASVITSLAIQSQLPRGELTTDDLNDLLAISLLLFIIPLVIVLPLAIHDLFVNLKQEWRVATQGRKIMIASSILFVTVAYVLLIVGDYAGWDHLLWFSES